MQILCWRARVQPQRTCNMVTKVRFVHGQGGRCAHAVASSSSEDEDGNETPTAGTYARPRPFVRSEARIHPRAQRRDVVKRNLRIVQEQLDMEMANAAQGVVMSEGGYIAMMNAIKTLWEQLSPHPDPRPVEVN